MFRGALNNGQRGYSQQIHLTRALHWFGRSWREARLKLDATTSYMQDELHHLWGTFIHYCFIKSYTRLAAITVAQKQWRCRNQDGILPPHLAAGEKCSQNETHSTYTLIPWQSRHVNEKHNYKVQLAEDGEKLPLFTFIAVNPKKIERISNSSLCTVLFSDLSQCFGNCEKPPVGIVGCYVTSAIFYCLTSFGFFCVVFFFF